MVGYQQPAGCQTVQNRTVYICKNKITSTLTGFLTMLNFLVPLYIYDLDICEINFTSKMIGFLAILKFLVPLYIYELVKSEHGISITRVGN